MSSSAKVAFICNGEKEVIFEYTPSGNLHPADQCWNINPNGMETVPEPFKNCYKRSQRDIGVSDATACYYQDQGHHGLAQNVRVPLLN